MENPEATWAAFKRHQGLRWGFWIRERPNEIGFYRKVSSGRRMIWALMPFVAALVVPTVVALTAVDGFGAYLAWIAMIFVGFISASVLWFILLAVWVRKTAWVKIRSGVVDVNMADVRMSIPAENIERITLGPNNSVTIWDHGIAVPVFPTNHAEASVALRTGMEAAFRMINPGPKPNDGVTIS